MRRTYEDIYQIDSLLQEPLSKNIVSLARKNGDGKSHIDTPYSGSNLQNIAEVGYEICIHHMRHQQHVERIEGSGRR